MAKVKGVQIKAILTFLRNQYGEQAVNNAIEALPTEVRALLPGVPLDSTWYSWDVFRPIRRISRALAPANGPDITIDMGKFIADYTLGGLYKSLLEKDPIKQVEKFSWVHDFFFEDSQKIETTKLSDTSCVVRYRYEPGLRPARSTCISTMGFWMRAVELSGGANASGKHSKCVIEGDDYCEYLLSWAAPLVRPAASGDNRSGG